MILVGNQRGGAKDLSKHLLKAENEHVDVHDLRGFVSGNLTGALNEAYAISRATKCKQFLFSLSLNPPPEENVSIADFEAAIRRVEGKLGLDGQPRAIVFHEKQGRRHCHVVWSRIKVEELKAVQLSYSKKKLMAVSRDLFLEHGWKMPKGLMNPQFRDPCNFSLAEWQQAKRVGKNAREVKAAIQDCWAVSDTKQAFAAALEEHGYRLARGDRRSFVAVDIHGEVYAIARAVGIKTKAVKDRLGDETSCPSVAQCQEALAKQVSTRLQRLEAAYDRLCAMQQNRLKTERTALVLRHKQARKDQKTAQQSRWDKETMARQARFSRGLRSLWDRLTGQRSRVKEQNERETLEARKRDQAEKEALIFKQMDERRALQSRIQKLHDRQKEQSDMLQEDIVLSENRLEEARRNQLEELDKPRRRRHERGPEREL